MRLYALAIAVPALVGCQHAGPSPEVKAQFDANNAQLMQMRDAKKIGWVQWANESNAAFMRLYGPQNSSVSTIMAYRVAIAAEVDAKRVTPEHGAYLIQQKISDESSAAERRMNERAMVNAANKSVVCNRVGATTICY